MRLGAIIDYKRRTDEDFDEIIQRLSGMLKRARMRREERREEGRGEGSRASIND